jgi:carboxymethylenebutenolidase
MDLRPLLFALVLPLGAAAPAQEPPKPAEDPVKERLEGSPRHHEWVAVEREGRKVHTFVVYPERAEKAPAVLVIHENKGLTDWVRSVADRLAEEGCIALAPDLLSGHGPEGGRTDSFASTDAATRALYELEPNEVAADLDAVASYALARPACDGKLFVAGFCWGGSQSFRFATLRKGLEACFVFYGSAPTDDEALARIDCPVHGFYGESDARINATLEATSAAMKRLGKTFEPVIYPGAGHGFLRAGEARDASEANAKARAEAWARWKRLLGV